MVMSAVTKARAALATAKKAFKKRGTPATVRAGARSTTPKLDKMLPSATKARQAKIIRDKRKRLVAEARKKNPGIDAARNAARKSVGKGAAVGAGLGAAGYVASRGKGGAQAASSYTIKRGDTLSQIAKKKGVSLKSLMDANKGIKNANKINSGQKIKIPTSKASKGSVYSGLTKSEMAALSKKKPVVKKKMAGGRVKKKMAGGVVKKKMAGGRVKKK